MPQAIAGFNDPLAQALMLSGGDPNAAQALLQSERQQQLGQALTGQALAGPRAPEAISGGKYTVAPRMSPVTGIAGPMVQALLGTKLSNQGIQGYARAMQGFGGGDYSPGSANNPAGLPSQAAARLAINDPKGYAEIEYPQSFREAFVRNKGDMQATLKDLRDLQAKATTVEARSGVVGNATSNGFTPNFNVPQGGVQTEYGPNGPTQRVVPGAPEAAATMQGAETAAREANTPRLIPQGGGVEKLGYPGTPPALQGQQPGGVPRWFPPAAPTKPAAAQAAPPPAAPPGSMWNNVPRVVIPHTPGQSSDAYTTGVMHNAVKKDEELTNQYSQQARTADARIAYNREALKVLNDSVTGPASDTVTKLSALAAQYGIKNAPFLPSAQQAANTQELKKFLLQNPLQNLKPTFGGRPAASEFQILANDASPSNTMLNAAIRRLVELDTTKAQYEKQQANDYSRYQSQGGDPRQFEQWYPDHKPLGTAFLKADTPPAALERLRQNPDKLGDFRAKYGWAPGPDD